MRGTNPAPKAEKCRKRQESLYKSNNVELYLCRKISTQLRRHIPEQSEAVTGNETLSSASNCCSNKAMNPTVIISLFSLFSVWIQSVTDHFLNSEAKV